MPFGGSILLWVGIFLGIFFGGYLSALTIYIVGKCLGFQVLFFRIFGFCLVYDRSGNRHFHKRNFTPNCTITMGIPGQIITDDEDHLHGLFHNLLYFLIAVILFVLAVWAFPEPTDLSMDTLYSFLVGTTAGILLRSVASALVFFSMERNKNKRILSYSKNIIHAMQQGRPIESLFLPPLEQLNLTGSNVEKHQYLNFRFMHLVATANTTALAFLVKQIESLLTPSFLEHETAAYYNLIFYYSYINCQPDKATNYYLTVYDKLKSDKDSNGCRVLAYYQYFIQKDPSSAKETAREGLSVLNDYLLTLGEIAYEQKLLTDLLCTIDTYFPQI